MARSNNQDRTGAPQGRPARPAQPVDHGLPWANNGAAGHPTDPQFGGPQFGGQPGYDVPPTGQPQQGQPPAQLPWPSAGGHPPQQPQQHYAQPSYPPQATYPPQQGYAPDPQFGQYLPQSGPAYPPAQGYPEQAPPLRGSYAQSEPSYAQVTAQAAYPQGQPAYAPPHAPPPNQGFDPRTQDPQAYDFGAYATQAPADYGHQAAAPGHSLPPQASRGAPPPPPPMQGFPSAYGQQPQGHAGYDQGFGQPQHGDSEEDYDEEYDEDEDEEDAPRSFGLLKIAASIIVAIGIGGGAAYGYKMFGGKISTGGAPIVFKADASPAKARPTQFANADANAASSASERLGGDQVPQVVPSGDTPSGDMTPAGARKVQTIAIAPPGATASNEPPMRPTITMPGLAVESGPAAPPTAPQPRVVMQPPVLPAPVARPSAPPVAPKVIAAAAPPAAIVVDTPKPAPAKKIVVAKATSKTSDAYAPGAGTGTATVATATATPESAATPKPASNGYVAVLFSLGNAVDARKQLDALQGKYPDVLGGKPTDVTEVTVKGQQYFRAIVGPPSSAQAVKALCNQLSAAGHKDCFAAAY